MANAEYINFFDLSFERKNHLKWAKQYWKLTFIASAIYVLLIFTGKRLMASRQPFNLRALLIVWSGFLATFSIAISYHWIQTAIFVWKNQGLYGLMCSSHTAFNDPAVQIWNFLYVMSKIAEFGDTFFIVLRKQKLSFLHWYHHMSVLLHATYFYQKQVSLCLVIGLVNTTVHSFMYSYFTLKAMRINIPRFVAMGITVLQLAQMLLGLFYSFYVYNVLIRGEKCDTDFGDLKVSSFVFFSYFLLFLNFFYNSYVRKLKVN